MMTMGIEVFCGFDHEASKRGGGSEKEEYFTNAHKANALLIRVLLMLKSVELFYLKQSAVEYKHSEHCANIQM